MKKFAATALALAFCGFLVATASGAFIVHLIDKEIDLSRATGEVSGREQDR